MCPFKLANHQIALIDFGKKNLGLPQKKIGGSQKIIAISIFFDKKSKKKIWGYPKFLWRISRFFHKNSKKNIFDKNSKKKNLGVSKIFVENFKNWKKNLGVTKI